MLFSLQKLRKKSLVIRENARRRKRRKLMAKIKPIQYYKYKKTLTGVGTPGNKVKPPKNPTLMPKKKITPGKAGINIVPGN